MKKYYIHTKTKIVMGFLVAIPFILTEVISDYLWWKVLQIIRFPIVWVPQSSFDAHWWYYVVALAGEILFLYLIGLFLSPYDEKIDAFIKKIPVIGYIYSKINDFFTTKKSPKGVPIVLNPYNSPYGNLYALIPTFERRLMYCTQQQAEVWCYTVWFVPNGNVVGGHLQHYPCDYIEKEMQLQQYGKLTFDQFIAYCVSFGMTFPQDLVQKADELVPEFIAKRIKEQQKTTS